MLIPLSAADAQLLREFFQEARYTHEELEHRQLRLDLPSRGNLPVLLDATSEPSIPNLILHWFLLGAPAAFESAARLLPPSVLELLSECGLLVRDEASLSAAAMLTPWEGCLFAADTAARLESHARDQVIWPNPTTRLLHQFTIRHPSAATMDLGTGCGIQAVFAARHSGQVTASDLNPRAAEFVRFNAWLNGTPNIDFVPGDTFEPVQNRRFDLIVANPPFFVTPSADQLYCQNDMELDHYCRRIAREAPDHLKEGGYLQMVCEWVQLRGESWQQRLIEWLDGAGCDAWIFHTYGCAAGAYAWERIPHAAPSGGRADSLARWMDYYRQREVEQIHGGLLAMRRRTGRNWVRIEDTPLDAQRPFGETVSRAFACVDQLELHGSDEELLGARLRLSPDTQLDRQMRQAGGRWQTAHTILHFTAGIPASLRLDAAVAEFLARLDGSRTLGELVGELAQQVCADPGVVERECLAAVRMLVERRFVEL
ncbi:MAG: methyltransferase [Bryobacteraceae bacterium]